MLQTYFYPKEKKSQQSIGPDGEITKQTLYNNLRPPLTLSSDYEDALADRNSICTDWNLFKISKPILMTHKVWCS